ncbi:PKD domain-containing protein [Flavobacterium sp. JP2137]|uniref:PKD domain-containing protein n=1 Tax=Flavobacterium sp. JP2137 TaxID=3414510 RepID=UPI003D2FE092
MPPSANPNVVCLNSPFVIKDLSSTNGGSQLVSYEWDFGDGNVSYEKNPLHSYNSQGNYTIKLKVTNECNCSSTYELNIAVDKSTASVITCPTVSCEASVQTYEVESNCGGSWFVEGGEIVEESSNSIKVLWNQVDAEGFGFVSFISDCGCRNWTTVKIPLIQSKGTIKGNPTACVGRQQRFALPQWPTTDFQWEVIPLDGGQGTLTQVDQRNEIVFGSSEAGRYLLVCNYTNTMLKCGGRAEIEIEVVDVPQIEGPTSLCSNVTAVAYRSHLNVELFWQVRSGNTLVYSHTGTTLDWENPEAGVYTITATNENYCTSAPLVVEVNEIPDISEVPLIGDKMICPGAPYLYSIVNENHNFTFLWEVSNGQIHGSPYGNEASISFNDLNPNRDTSYIITVWKVSLNNEQCKSEAKTFEIFPINPVARFENVENTTFFCPSAYSNFTVNFEHDLVPDYMFWEAVPSNFANIVEGQGTPNVKVSWNEISDSSSGYLRLVIRKCDRIYEFSHPITLAEAPTFTWLNPEPLDLCVKNYFLVTLQSSTNLVGGQVSWDLNDGSEPTLPADISGTSIVSPPLRYLSEITDDVQRMVTAIIIDPNGCRTEIKVDLAINLHPLPASAVSPGGIIYFCADRNYTKTLYASSQLDISPQNIVWYKDDVNTIIGYGPTYTVTGSPAQSGAGRYFVKMTSDSGCVSFSAATRILEECGEPCELTNQNVSISGRQSCNTFVFNGSFTGTPYSVSWSGSEHLERLPEYTDHTITFTTKIPGLHIVNYIVTYLVNGVKCSKIATYEFFKPYEAKFKYSMSCLGTNNTRDVTLIDNSIYADRNNVTYIYKKNGVVAYSGPIEEYTFQNLAPGFYDFTVELRNGSAYICSETKRVEVKGRPNPIFTVIHQPQCIENPFLLTPNVVDPEYEYTWEFNNTSIRIPNAVINLPIENVEYYIKLTVADRYGCSMSSTQGPFVSHKASFPPSRVSPSSSTFCGGGSIDLSVDVSGPIQPTAYQWMDGPNQIVGATAAHFEATQTGNYWAVLYDANGCGFYETISAGVISKAPPMATVTKPSATCSGSPIKIGATVTDPLALRQWIRNGTILYDYNIATPLELEEYLPEGDYVYVFNVLDPNNADCQENKTIEFTVTPPPQTPNIWFSVIQCSPYKVQLNVDEAPNNTYVWSNGMVGSVIEVNDGGPYRVRIIGENGCEATQHIQVPKHSDVYMWVVPTGCIDICATKDPVWFTILGPLPFFTKHDWIRNDSAVQSGSYSPVNPLNVGAEGAYSLNLFQEVCESSSKVLNVTASGNDCGHCKVDIQSKESYVRYKSPYSYIEFDLIIGNATGEYVQYSFENPENEGVFVPNSIGLQPGEYQTLQGVRFIPFDSNYNQSSTTLQVLVRVNGKIVCDWNYLTLDFSSVTQRRPGETTPENVVTTAKLSPNPTQGESVLYYETTLVSAEADIVVEVFDMLGKRHWSGKATTSNGQVAIPAYRLVTGKYMVVLHVNGQRTYQHILIKN